MAGGSQSPQTTSICPALELPSPHAIVAVNSEGTPDLLLEVNVATTAFTGVPAVAENVVPFGDPGAAGAAGGSAAASATAHAAATEALRRTDPASRAASSCACTASRCGSGP